MDLLVKLSLLLACSIARVDAGTKSLALDELGRTIANSKVSTDSTKTALSTDQRTDEKSKCSLPLLSDRLPSTCLHGSQHYEYAAVCHNFYGLVYGR